MMKIIKNTTLMFLAPLAFSFVAGCQVVSDGEDVCTPNIKPGFKIRVFDQDSGLPISCGTSAVVTEGEYEEYHSIEATPICVDTSAMPAAYERVGVYEVTVNKPGYVTEVVSDVEVTMSDGCSVDSYDLNVFMTAE
jgi:hypothetical protein